MDLFVQAKINQKKKSQDRISKNISLGLAWLFSLVFFCLIVFIIIASIPGIKEYGIVNILFTNVFNLQKGKASIWMPFLITILTAGLAIVLAGPIGIKTAIFIKYRISKKRQKPIRVSIELLANIPSVIFGLFAAEGLGAFLNESLNIDAYSLITAGVMLTFMIIPTVVSLTINALDGCDPTLISAAMVLGNTKTRAIYRVCKKQASAGITVGIIIALTRAIGETMAVSMLLQSQGYTQAFNDGFWGFVNSNLRTLGAFISANMFAEGGGPGLQGLLFTYGLILFLFVMILNAIAIKMTKRKAKSKYGWWNKFENGVAFFVLFIPRQINALWEKITYHSKVSKSELSLYLSTRTQKNKFIKSYSTWKKFWEFLSIAITSIFLIWILINIVGYGSVAAVNMQYTSVFSFVKDTTGQAFVNTLLIIVLAIGIGLPISLMIAIYVNEFAAETKNKKAIIFFIDSLGATPSILFGMFGLIFFIQTLGMSSNGSEGKSLIAGALTILIVILPTFIRTIQQALASVPRDLRTNSYALGCGRWETIRKVVLPTALQGIITSVVLSIGRILAETAPLYLTSGLSSSNNIALNGAGQTLTTRIYAQIYESNLEKGRSIMYECAFVTLLLVLVIIFFIHFIIPLYFKRKEARTRIDLGRPKRKRATNIHRSTKPMIKHKMQRSNYQSITPNLNYHMIRRH